MKLNLKKVKSFIAFALLFQISTHAAILKGIVFVDENNNGIYNNGEQVLQGVAISNGTDVVLTNKKGEYEIEAPDESCIFLIKPANYISALSEVNIPQNYLYNKPKGSPEMEYPGIRASALPRRYNFTLYPHIEGDSIKVCLMGDPQVKIKDDVFYTGKVIAEQMLDEQYDFAMPLGDLAFDNLNLFTPLQKVFAQLDAPVFYVFGNHDRNLDATSQELQDESFKALFGPSYYAFNYGPSTFIVLNSVGHIPGESKYKNNIDERQIRFVKNLLKNIPAERQIFICMHIPLVYVENKNDLLGLFVHHPNVAAFSGHTHTQFYYYHTQEDGWPHAKPMKELVAGALCGSWWRGEKDIYGVPQSLMRDGTPKGFWTMSVTKSDYKMHYHVSGNKADMQMHIWTPYTFDKELYSDTSRIIIANVFAGHKETKVECKIGKGNWHPMQYSNQEDPFYRRLLALQEQGITPSGNAEKIPKEIVDSEIWIYNIIDDLPKGVYTITVRVSDNMGLNTTGKTVLFND